MTVWGGYVQSNNYQLTLATLIVNLKNAAPSYHSISLPYTNELITMLTGLTIPGSVVKITRDGTDWSQFNIDTVSFTKGGNNATAQVNGYRQVTYSSPTSRSLTNASVGYRRLLTDGSYSISVDPDLVIYPQDIITLNGVNYTVKKADYTLNSIVKTFVLNATVNP